MTSEPAAGSKAVSQANILLASHWPAFLGIALLAVPTFARLGNQIWSTEAGGHGPIVLATGLWLLVHRLNTLSKSPVVTGSAAIVALGFAASSLLYIFGRAYGLLSAEVSGLFLYLVVILVSAVGGAVLRQLAFPIFYLAFIIPPPGWIVDEITSPLRIFVSRVASEIMFAAGYPILRGGVAMYVGSYQLLVEDACSGLNSIVGLTAVTLLYAYLMHRTSKWHAAILIASIVPVAVLINIVRVIALIFITYNYGDAAGQSYLHVTTGVVLFAVAVFLIFLLDRVLQKCLEHRLVSA